MHQDPKIALAVASIGALGAIGAAIFMISPDVFDRAKPYLPEITSSGNSAINAEGTAAEILEQAKNFRRIEATKFTLDDQTFDEDTFIVTEKLELVADGKVRVKNSKHLVIKTKLLEILGPFKFDGKGEAGSPGVSPAPWVSGAGHPHRHWLEAGSHPDETGKAGGDGKPGASIAILFEEAIDPYRLPNINASVDGGDAGEGGRGRAMICGEHPHEIKYGPTGPNGSPGPAGNFVLQKVSASQ